MSEAIVWITGASAGIGAAMARQVPYAARVIDISRSGGTPGTEHFAADLANPSDWDRVAEHFGSHLAKTSAARVSLVQCAGVIDPVGFAGEVDDAAYRTNVLLNGAAPQVLGHAFLSALRESGFEGPADLAILTSGAAKRPYPGWSGYSAGKAAVDAWVRAVGQEQELRGSRCTVRAIGPGVVGTAMQSRIRQADPRDFPAIEKFERLHARGELADPADAARDVWALIEEPNLGNGAVVDVRDLNR